MVPPTWCIHYWSDLAQTSYGCSLTYSLGVRFEFSWIFFLEIRFFPTFPIVMDLEKFRSNHGSHNLVHSSLVIYSWNFVWKLIFFYLVISFFSAIMDLENFRLNHGSSNLVHSLLFRSCWNLTSHRCSLTYSLGVTVKFFFFWKSGFLLFSTIMDLENFGLNHCSPNLVH